MIYSADAFPEKKPESPRFLQYEISEDKKGATFIIDDTTTPEDFELTLGYLQEDEAERQRTRDALLKHLVEKKWLLNKKTLVLEESSQEPTDQSHIELRVFLTFKDNPKFSDLTEALHAHFDDEEKEAEERNKILHQAITKHKLVYTPIDIKLSNKMLNGTEEEMSILASFLKFDLED